SSSRESVFRVLLIPTHPRPSPRGRREGIYPSASSPLGMRFRKASIIPANRIVSSRSLDFSPTLTDILYLDLIQASRMFCYLFRESHTSLLTASAESWYGENKLGMFSRCNEFLALC